MNKWIVRIVLALGALSAAAGAGAADAPVEPAPTEQVISPDLERRTVTIPKIHATDLELGVYIGTLSIENFGAKTSRGARLAFHVTEKLFVEGVYGKSTISDEFYRERAFPISGFKKGENPLTYYNVSLGYNLLPGESFITQRWAVASAFYLIGGIGTTTFAGRSYSTMNYGFGYRLLLTDWFTWHVDMRDHVFSHSLLGTSQRTDNFEMTTGFTVFF
jgi:outer membrane beta-barrel protein